LTRGKTLIFNILILVVFMILKEFNQLSEELDIDIVQFKGREITL
tara:strand:+ start:23631 stop:23765 length:135 start_codon:yes stop_codon:yes gene_type:complete